MKLARMLAIASVCLWGCASGTSGDDAATGDTSMPREDTGVADTSSVSCGAGQHACGGGCIDDLANAPENGCRLGCGEPCPVPPDGAASCDASGMCTFGCEPPFMLVGTMCVCEPMTCAELDAMCGAPDDGCGSPIDCGACDAGGTCTDGRCSCPEDSREPNETFGDADGQPVLFDIPNEDWSMEYSMFGMHAASDVDVFRFTVADSGLFNPEPLVRVDLTSIPTGANYDLAAYYVCNSGGNSTACQIGAPDNAIGVGCKSTSAGTAADTVEVDVECDNGTSTDDSGTLYIRVTAPTHGGMCAPYRLAIDITS